MPNPDELLVDQLPPEPDIENLSPAEQMMSEEGEIPVEEEEGTAPSVTSLSLEEVPELMNLEVGESGSFEIIGKSPDGKTVDIQFGAAAGEAQPPAPPGMGAGRSAVRGALAG